MKWIKMDSKDIYKRFPISIQINAILKCIQTQNVF